MSNRIRDLIASLTSGLGELQAEVDRVLPVDPGNGQTGELLRVKPGDDLAAAILSLKDGGTILGAPGEYRMNLKFAERASKAVVTVKTDTANLPGDGKRITRDYLPGLMTIRATPGDMFAPAVEAKHRSSGLAFVGVAFGPQHYDRTVVDLGGDAHALNRVEDRASNFLFDRCLWYGDEQRGQHRGLQPHALNVLVRGCGFYDMHEQGRDSQAICGWNGTENLTIENSYLEGGAENVMFGGADSASLELSPKNVRIIGCHFRKPLAWKSLTQYPPSIKALFEIKNIRGLYMAGCLFEQNWRRDWASGVAITLKAANGGGHEPWATLEDVVIEDCVIRHVGSAFNIVGWNDGLKAGGTHKGRNVTLRNILIYDVNQGEWTGDGRGVTFYNATPDDMTVDHLTMIDRQTSTWAGLYPHSTAPDAGHGKNFKFTNSVVDEGAYGVHASNGLGKAAFDLNMVLPYTVTGNAVRKGPRTIRYPEGNTVLAPADVDGSFNADKSIRDGSPLAGVTTTDGSRVGADVGKILLRLADPL